MDKFPSPPACGPFSKARLFSILVLAGFLAIPLLAQEPAPAAAQPPQRRLISLVMLLREPRALDATALAAAVGNLAGEEARGGVTVVAKPPRFLLRLKTGAFIVNNFDKPYFDDPQRLAQEVKDHALGESVLTHRGWLSVDWAQAEQVPDLTGVYQQIGKLIAALAGPDTLAVYCPDTDHFNMYDARLREALVSADPLKNFIPAPTPHTAPVAASGAPMAPASTAPAAPAGGVASTPATPAPQPGSVVVSDDDPRLRAAEAESRRLWPEFLAAFQKRHGTTGFFSVKGRIAEGEQTEYLWIKVSEIDDQVVHGFLENRPAGLTKLQAGQEVHITLKEVDDWLYSLGEGQPTLGGFTLRVLDEIVRQQQPAATSIPAQPAPR